MGVLGFEPRTSALSELRSSQLSYTPSNGESIIVPIRSLCVQRWIDPAFGLDSGYVCRFGWIFRQRWPSQLR